MKRILFRQFCDEPYGGDEDDVCQEEVIQEGIGGHRSVLPSIPPVEPGLQQVFQHLLRSSSHHRVSGRQI